VSQNSLVSQLVQDGDWQLFIAVIHHNRHHPTHPQLAVPALVHFRTLVTLRRVRVRVGLELRLGLELGLGLGWVRFRVRIRIGLGLG